MNQKNSLAVRSLISAAAAAVLLAGLAAMSTGCKDESADITQQIQARGSNRTGNTPGNFTDDRAAKAPESGAEAAKPGRPELPGKPGLPAKPDAGTEAAAGEAPADAEAEDAEKGPEVEVAMKNLKAPYPRFDKAGYYDFDLEVTAKESIEPKVWEIVAVDEEGNTLGSQKQMMVLILNRPKTFAFRSFYCSRMPSDVKLVFTGKDAIKAEASDGAQHGGGAGVGLGGGSGNRGAGSGGAAGGGKGGSGGGSGGDDGGDEGGIDEGGE